MNLFWKYSGPMLLHEFGGGPGIGGRGGDSTKTNSSVSETKDNSATAGGDNYGGGEGNTVTVNSDAVALEGIHLIEQLAAGGAGLLTSFQTQNTQLADNTNARLASLATTQATGGANITQNSMLIMLAIGGAVLVLPALLRKK